MIRVRRALSAPLAVLVLGGASLVSTGANAGEIAPFRASLSVRWGRGAGPDAFRDDLSRSLAAALATRCFTGVAITDGQIEDTDLTLVVVLSDVLDETRFDDSIAGSLRQGEPEQELRRVARFQVTADATLAATGAIVHRGRTVARVSRRPTYLGEDPQATARAQAIERIVGDLEDALGCGGKKLGRKIRTALGVAGPPPSLSR